MIDDVQSKSSESLPVVNKWRQAWWGLGFMIHYATWSCAVNVGCYVCFCCVTLLHKITNINTNLNLHESLQILLKCQKIFSVVSTDTLRQESHCPLLLGGEVDRTVCRVARLGIFKLIIPQYVAKSKINVSNAYSDFYRYSAKISRQKSAHQKFLSYFSNKIIGLLSGFYVDSEMLKMASIIKPSWTRVLSKTRLYSGWLYAGNSLL